MVKYFDECCGCEIGCIGKTCSCLNVPHIFCDRCGDELDMGGYEFDGEILCPFCADELDDIEEISRDEILHVYERSYS